MEREQQQIRHDTLEELVNILRCFTLVRTTRDIIQKLNVPVKPRRKWTRPPEPGTGKLSLSANNNLNGLMNTMPAVNLPSREVHLIGYRGVNKVINDYNG